jgi:hypothetical protein
MLTQTLMKTTLTVTTAIAMITPVVAATEGGFRAEMIRFTITMLKKEVIIIVIFIEPWTDDVLYLESDDKVVYRNSNVFCAKISLLKQAFCFP